MRDHSPADCATITSDELAAKLPTITSHAELDGFTAQLERDGRNNATSSKAIAARRLELNGGRK